MNTLEKHLETSIHSFQRSFQPQSQSFTVVPVTMRRAPLTTPLAPKVHNPAQTNTTQKVLGQKRARSDNEVSICGCFLPMRSSLFHSNGSNQPQNAQRRVDTKFLGQARSVVIGSNSAVKGGGKSDNQQNAKNDKGNTHEDVRELVSTTAPTNSRVQEDPQMSYLHATVEANAIILDEVFSKLPRGVQFASKKTGAIYPRVRTVEGREALVVADASDEIDAIFLTPIFLNKQVAK